MNKITTPIALLSLICALTLTPPTHAGVVGKTLNIATRPISVAAKVSTKVVKTAAHIATAPIKAIRR